jgi:transformation/transcription domain-associated protein
MLLVIGKSISYEVCEVLFTYLAENVVVLSDFHRSQHEGQAEINNTTNQPSQATTVRAQNHFKLFITLFSSLAKYPKNELALLPRLRAFVSDCIGHAMEGPAIWPGPYLCVVRMLFRVLQVGKCEASFREIAPLIPALLNGFYRVYSATADDSLRLMITELTLTTPSNMTILLPHLPLLLQMIISALQSKRGDLINMGLRCLEFWIDSLHTDYLYPVLAHSKHTLCTLMVSLTEHLKPAPYPHGLLCLRLIGKLGGKNRLFLNEVVGQDCKNKMSYPGLSMLFEWQQQNQPEFDDSGSHPFGLRLPLERAVDILRYVASAPRFVATKDETATIELPLDSHRAYVEGLFGHAECLDLNSHAVDLMEKTKLEQATSALAIIRGALASILDVNESDKVNLPMPDTPTTDTVQESPSNDNDSPDPLAQNDSVICISALKLICDGLFIATTISYLNEEATTLLLGLASHIIFMIESHINCITRIDCDGAAVDNSNRAVFDQNHISAGKLQPLQSFGVFRLSHPLSEGIDPFVFNEAIVYALSGSKQSQHAATKVMSFMLDPTHKIESSVPKMEVELSQPHLNAGDAFAENLLNSLCQACFAQQWNHRSSLMITIVDLMNRKGLTWSKRFEVEILHVSMFMVKDAPAEITIASKEALAFVSFFDLLLLTQRLHHSLHVHVAIPPQFVTVTWFFFGGPKAWDSGTMIHDILSPKPALSSPESEKIDHSVISQASLTLIISELGSNKQLVRFAVRHFLRIVFRDNSFDSAIKDNSASLKRLIFPRILRNSPLPEQVAIVESIAFMMDRAPSLITIEDQTCISFTAELIKMTSVAGKISFCVHEQH